MPSSVYVEAQRLMGLRVVVWQRLVRDCREDDKRLWVAEDIDKTVGWVVGVRWKQNGTYNPGHNASAWLPDDDVPPYLAVESTVPCLLVAPWPTINPLFVPMGGYRDAMYWEQPQPPRQPDCNEHVRAALSADAKAAPRDERGRFAKMRCDTIKEGGR